MKAVCLSGRSRRQIARAKRKQNKIRKTVLSFDTHQPFMTRVTTVRLFYKKNPRKNRGYFTEIFQISRMTEDISSHVFNTFRFALYAAAASVILTVSAIKETSEAA